MEWATALPVGAAIAGSLATFAGTSLIQRARPSAVVDTCQAGTGYAVEVRVRPDKALLMALAATPEVGDSYVWQNRWDDLLEIEYVEALVQTRSELQLHRNRLPRLKETVEKLRKHSFAENWLALQLEWAQNNAQLWSPLVTAFSRGAAIDLVSDIEGDLPVAISRGDGWIGLDIAKAQLRFTHSVDDPRQVEFAVKTAVAIATGNKRDISRLLDQLESYIDETRIEELVTQIEPELKRFEHLHISGHLTNTGRLPYSVHNRAQVFVQQKGHNTTVPAGGGGAVSVTPHRFDRSVEMLIVANVGDDLDYEMPISVPAGAVVPFVAFSLKTFEDMDSGDELTRKLSVATNVRAQFGFQVSVAGKRKAVRTLSPAFNFVTATSSGSLRPPRYVRKGRISLRRWDEPEISSDAKNASERSH